MKTNGSLYPSEYQTKPKKTETKMKKKGIIYILSILIMMSCVTSPPAVEGLLGFNEAIEQIITDIDNTVKPGTEVGVTRLEAPTLEISNHLYNELINALSIGRNLKVLAGGNDTSALDAEHQHQMSGLVDDKSVVGIGHYLGAKIMLTGSFTSFGNFSQFSVRALDVLTGEVLIASRPRIRNDDAILASVTSSLRDFGAINVTEDALEHLNIGKDYYASGLYEGAIGEFDKALALNKKLSEAWAYRGRAYNKIWDLKKAIQDLTKAIKLNPSYADAYYWRAIAYNNNFEFVKAVADGTQAIRLNPLNAEYYVSRGIDILNVNNRNYRSAMADFNQGIMLDPNYYYGYQNREYAYAMREMWDQAIEDYNKAISLIPQEENGYWYRGDAYYAKGDYNRAIEDYSQLIKLDPDNDNWWRIRGDAYYAKRDYRRAIADYEMCLRIQPDYNEDVEESLKLARKAL